MLDRLIMAGHAMTTRMYQMEVVTNNLANIDTTAFKKNNIFVEELENQLKTPQFGSSSQVPDSKSIIDFGQGALVGTSRPLDVAISGNGLFVVETPEGESYARDGRFSVNAEGILISLDGLPVLGEGGPIELNLQQSSASEIVINEKGEILLDENVIGALKIVSVANPQDFMKAGANLFRLVNQANELEPAKDFSIKQGFLEEANVNPIEEMVAMMEIFHFYQSAEKMIRAQDNLLGRAVNDIARI